MSESWRKSREIIERIVVEGNLVLLTPTSLGNGDAEGLTDISLLLDEVDGSALLTGTSIAGALRNYLRERKHGFEQAEDNGSICRKLFGWHKDEDDGVQSCLIIDDARSIDEKGQPKLPTTELRDGVRIDGKTRTAADKAKYDLELLETGTTFTLRFELLISENRNNLVSAFATALEGFEKGEIFLGARKRRGYGECKVKNWRVKTFDLTKQDGLVDWLKNGAMELSKGNEQTISHAFSHALSASPIQDQREYFEIKACFALDGSMLIRSGAQVSDNVQPDSVHLRSKHKDKGYVPIISGTSLAGVLRHRAVKICNTISSGKGEDFVEKFFGTDMKKLKERNQVTKEQPFASRLEVRETDITNTNDLIQTRVKIDRFTGGAYDGALFDAAPVFAKDNGKAIELSLKLRSPKDCEIGLLLLLLKDLWTSDLPIGGESSIGRGRLKGLSANLHYRKTETDFWKTCLEGTGQIKADSTEGNLPADKTETDYLNDLVTQLKDELEKTP